MDFRIALVNAPLRLVAQVYSRMQPGTAFSKVVNDLQQILQITGGVGMALLRTASRSANSTKLSSHCL